MGKLIVHEFMSLDGVVQAPGGKNEDTDGGFAHGGWTIPYWHNDIGMHFHTLMESSDTFLLGRKTWQIHGAAFDPMPIGNPFGDEMKRIKKIVVSTTLESAALWRNSTILRHDVIDGIRMLKKKNTKNILIDGSSVLVRALMEHDLIDEFHLHVYPLILGTGKRIFPEGKRTDLELVTARVLPTGVVFQEYRLKK